MAIRFLPPTGILPGSLRSLLPGQLGAILLAACAGPAPLVVPGNLKPASHESLQAIVAARGVQIYQCRAGRDPARGNEWVFVAPEADLLDPQGGVIGKHGAGPYWLAGDGSRVVGTLKERADAPVTNAIPWLLLATRSVGPEGRFSKVTSIQRVNTVGGQAPAVGCTPDTIGQSVRVAYSADYYLYNSGR